MPAFDSIADRARDAIASEDGEGRRRTAIVTGSVAVGALLTGSIFRRIRHLKLSPPEDLEPALDADLHTLEIMEGRTRFYAREGAGVPIVLLHGIHAAGSSFEMKPLFDHLAASTERPIYALEWFGYGCSDRPPVRYTPSIYLRQLRRFLSEQVHQPADLVALSLSCEYAAELAGSLPYLVRRLALIGPTGLSEPRSRSILQRTAVSMASSVGAFEIFFHRLSRADVLRRFYQRQIFREVPVPEELVAYAWKTTHVQGAHHAPRYFVQGALSTGSAPAVYSALRVPALMVAPASSDGLVQQFDLLEETAAHNAAFLNVARLPGGLLPHWEGPDRLFQVLDAFLDARR
jgi:pimeloyl-ACP methyl ester carboxylesterase